MLFRSADREVQNLEKKGIKLIKDRDYITTESINLTVLTWNEGELTKQLAMASKDNRLTVVQTSCVQGEWKMYANTFWEVYRSLILL